MFMAQNSKMLVPDEIYKLLNPCLLPLTLPSLLSPDFLQKGKGADEGCPPSSQKNTVSEPARLG